MKIKNQYQKYQRMPELKIVFSKNTPVVNLEKIKVECSTTLGNCSHIYTVVFPKCRVNVVFPTVEPVFSYKPEPSTR